MTDSSLTFPFSTLAERKFLAGQSREEIRANQFQQLNRLITDVLPKNPFYAPRVAELRLPLSDMEDLSQIPLTLKSELQQPGRFPELEVVAAANHTYPLEHYTRFHQTSGTKGRPLAVMDTAEDWPKWIDTWQYVFDAAEVATEDRVFLAFSFGPFIGFWSAFDAATARGCLVIPGGGLTSEARLQTIINTRSTVLCCTPSYALHLAEVAKEKRIDLPACNIRVLVVAGEPGGSLPATRTKIESTWGAWVLDHAGASEVGAWGYGDREGSGMYINERDFLPEFLVPESEGVASPGDVAELVLSNLRRPGLPLLRYRTGDLVRVPEPATTGFAFLKGSVLGRVDDMLIIRGVNIYPTSIEQILREFPEVIEFRITAFRQAEMDELAIEIETDEQSKQIDAQAAEQLRLRLGLRVAVETVPAGTLPRFELKGRRFVDQRSE
ncbi:MAG: phenylacetate--CoA ligase family protein [Pirellulales bacterium]|nr:phenylacetate--CoA ligase family protein [Pirellulales bacterium]